mmetsp:Transcript_94873/g.268578  ORF Transcript_94873/g.268578 Transcript_94873/m.268578 type:complete len:224 (+) Transcript_94873:1128-1799(+)
MVSVLRIDLIASSCFPYLNVTIAEPVLRSSIFALLKFAHRVSTWGGSGHPNRWLLRECLYWMPAAREALEFVERELEHDATDLRVPEGRCLGRSSATSSEGTTFAYAASDWTDSRCSAAVGTELVSDDACEACSSASLGASLPSEADERELLLERARHVPTTCVSASGELKVTVFEDTPVEDIFETLGSKSVDSSALSLKWSGFHTCLSVPSPYSSSCPDCMR